MAQLAGTSNEDSLNLAANLTVGGTSGFVGAATFAGAVTFSGTVTNPNGALGAGTLYAAAGTVTLTSGYVVFNAAVAGFAVQLPAPKAGAYFEIINQVAPSGGNNTIVIPAGGTIYQGTVAGSVLTYSTVGQTTILRGISTTQYRSMLPGTTSATLS